VKAFGADIHIHSALSPCASVEMTPPAIVRAALEKKLAMIAICDHNSSGNSAAIQKAAAGLLTVLPGIEITTAEEVHVVGLFDNARAASAVAEKALATLPEKGKEPDKMFGGQHLMDAKGNSVGREVKMLAAATSFTLNEAISLIRENGGLAIAAHVDRPHFGVISQLGFFPEDAEFDAIEISRAGVRASRDKEFLSLGLPMIASSDSHFLLDVGSAMTIFEMRKPTFEELALALKGEGERRHWIA